MLRILSSLQRFATDFHGGVSIFFVLLVPALLVVGGIGIDISQLNAQKRHTQAQADLAALAAAGQLPNRVSARSAGIAAMRNNARCPKNTPGTEWGCEGDAAPDFTWLASDGVTFQDVTALTIPAGAVDVVVRSQFRPMLLGLILSNDSMQITGKARAQRFAENRGMASFRIYNNLLRLNTNDSILNYVLEPLGIGISADVLGAGGLASARIKLDDLIHLATAGVGLEVLSFNDVLNLAVPVEKLIGLALPGKKGDKPWVEVKRPAPAGSIRIEDILAMSPTLVGVKVGDILPDLELGLLDILTATAQLKGDQERIDLTQRLGLKASLKLIDPRIGDVQATLGLIRDGISAVAAPGIGPFPHAKLTQADVHLKLSLLNIIRIDLIVELVGGTATLTQLNCQARENTDDILASFDVVPYPAALLLSVNLLNEQAKFDAPRPSTAEAIRLLTSLDPRSVSFTRSAYDEARRTGKDLSYSIRGELDLSNLGNVVKQLIGNIKVGPQPENGKCGWNLLQCIINGVGELLGGIVGIVATILSDVLRIDDLLNFLLAKLGVQLIPVDLVLDSVSCRGANLGKAALIQ